MRKRFGRGAIEVSFSVVLSSGLYSKIGPLKMGQASGNEERREGTKKTAPTKKSTSSTWHLFLGLPHDMVDVEIAQVFQDGKGAASDGVEGLNFRLVSP
ncbi:hypothetical protein RJT34_04447 [Clitoria ternatea]|uniref:Uncharacterized protein n=1 Tax=Clitoria ternatea TaxID=43366 RepID=A0AAN9KLL2_CLITE